MVVFRQTSGLLVQLAVAASAFVLVASNPAGKYNEHDELSLIATKVGPFSNPSVTYPYYSLPFCQPDNVEHQSHNLGEILSGDRKVKMMYKLYFKADVQWAPLCTKSLSTSALAAFQQAVDEEYFAEMNLDGLPVVAYVGDSDKETDLVLELSDKFNAPHKYLYTHLHFNILFNKQNIISLSVTPIHKHDITEFKATVIADNPAFINAEPTMDIEFSYSVKWEETTMTLANRKERDNHFNLLPKSFEIHWVSIMNSFVLVVLLTVFLAVILMRVLKNDLSRYMAVADEEEELGDEESGWKLLHGDVFRFPANKMLFTAILGAGTQLLCVTLMILALSVLSVFSAKKKGALMTTSIILYAFTACVGGYVSGRMFRQMGGTNWVWNTILTAVLFPGPLLCVFMYVNTVAIAFESTAALPFGTIMVVFSLYCLVTFPLTVAGAIAGRNSTRDFEAPCRTTKVPRQIPEVPLYRQLPAQMFMAGFLPFSAIYIELHYVFASVWGHKIYTLFGILFLAFVMLIVVTSFITVAMTYFQLAQEDHQWWWRSLLSGASTGVFIFAYCFFYYYERSEMSGLLQTSYFFGYMFIVSYAFCLLLGTVGFFSSLIFVRRIYYAIKAE